ncbi:MAG: hypothetical protein NTW29_10570 [Bacteroidetes bacterium]|nr:hypothetical protein [Bacteroidota bacterium]
MRRSKNRKKTTGQLLVTSGKNLFSKKSSIIHRFGLKKRGVGEKLVSDEVLNFIRTNRRYIKMGQGVEKSELNREFNV